MNRLIEIPRINANEDQVQIVDIRVANGDRVAMDDVLFVVETTKAANEICASSNGVVRNVTAKIGDFVPVGAVLCEISSAESSVDSTTKGRPALAPAQPVVTAKARKLASTLGIDPSTIATTSGRVTEADVRDAARHAGDKFAPKESLIPATSRKSARRAIIIGGGGHAACIIDALEGSGYDLIGCTDTILPIGHHVSRGVSVIGTEKQLSSLRSNDIAFAFIGIGGADSSVCRQEKFCLAQSLGFMMPPAIHGSAKIASDTRIGDGCHILAGATIGPRCAIGNNVIINQGAIICHDSEIFDHAHITPGAILAGGVSVGQMTVVGMGVTVLLQVKIGRNCLIHNGANIVADVADDSIVDALGHRKLKPTEPR